MGLDNKIQKTEDKSLVSAADKLQETAEKSLLETPIPEEMAETNFGKLVKESDKKHKEKRKAKRSTKKSPKKTAEKKVEEKAEEKKEKEVSKVEKAAEHLASAGKRIEVKEDGEVEIDLDLTKLVKEDQDREKDMGLEEIFQPDVRECQVKIEEEDPDTGDKKTVMEKIVMRRTIDGRIGYYYEDNGKDVYLVLPKKGTASIKIPKEKLLKLSQKEVVQKMKEEATEVARQEAEKMADKIGTSEVETPPKPRTRAYSGGGRTTPRTPRRSSGSGGRTRGYHKSPSYSGSPSSMAPMSALENYNLPAKIKSPMNVKAEGITMTQNQSPTGMPLYMNISKHPEVRKAPPHYIVMFPGDGSSIGTTLSTFHIFQRLEKLRRAGINAILLIPDHNPNTSVKRDDKWDYFKDKPALIDKMMETAAQAAGKPIQDINLMSYSGGYRAVAAFLGKSKYSGQVKSISMLDSTFADQDDPIIEELTKYVQRGGQVRATTSKPTTTLGRQTRNGVSKIQERLRGHKNSGNFQVEHTSLSHRGSAKKGFWPHMLLAAGVKPETAAEASLKKIEFDQKKYPASYKQRIVRTEIPEEVPASERYVPRMKYKESLNYYESLMGRPPRKGWKIRKFNVFGTTINNPNIVLACLLRELEYRCNTKMKMNLKFGYITTTAGKSGPHGLGMAADFDPSDNDMVHVSKTKWNLPMAFVIEAQKMGCRWGMYFYTSRKDRRSDAMHFEPRIRLEHLMAQLTSPDAIQMAKTFKIPGSNTSLYAYGAMEAQRRRA